MNWFYDFSYSLGSILKDGYLDDIAGAIALTLLAIYGNEINKFVMKRVKAYNIVIRLAAFVLLCAVGYGLLSVWLIHFLELGLTIFGRAWLLPMLILFFCVTGFLASRKNQV